MKNKGKNIANEVWNMIPNSCKEIMTNIEKSFKASVEASVNDLFIFKSTEKCKCKRVTFTRTVDADFNCLCGKCDCQI